MGDLCRDPLIKKEGAKQLCTNIRVRFRGVWRMYRVWSLGLG